MHPGLLDVLHHAGDHHLSGGVADRVHVDLDRVFEEPVDEDGPLGRQPPFPAEGTEPRELLHGPGQPGVVVHDLHGPPSEHVARADESRVADALHHPPRFVEGGGGPPGGLGDLELRAEGRPPLAVLGQVDRRGGRAEDEPGGQTAGELQRRLPTEAHDHPLQGPGHALGLDHVEHVLVGDGLEVQPGAGVVVG